MSKWKQVYTILKINLWLFKIKVKNVLTRIKEWFKMVFNWRYWV